MTKEELEKEAEEKGIKYADSLKMDIKVEDGVEGYAWYQVEQAYEKGALDFAEPREKQIQIDAEQIRALQKQNGELTDRVRELKAQIEKLQKINNEQKETLKKVRVALIQERTANIMNYGKGGVEMFDDCFEILKGVSN